MSNARRSAPGLVEGQVGSTGRRPVEGRFRWAESSGGKWRAPLLGCRRLGSAPSGRIGDRFEPARNPRRLPNATRLATGRFRCFASPLLAAVLRQLPV